VLLLEVGACGEMVHSKRGMHPTARSALLFCKARAILMHKLQAGIAIYFAYISLFSWRLVKNDLGDFQFLLWGLQWLGLSLILVCAFNSERRYMYSIFVFLLNPVFQILVFYVRDQYYQRVSEEAISFWPLVLALVVLPSIIVSLLSFGTALLFRNVAV
jgi:hypothetical protein